MTPDNKFPDGTPVTTPFPLSDEQAAGDRDAWPWVAGTIDQQAGDEWAVVIGDRRAAHLENGLPAPDGTPEDQLCWPVVFRDASELRAISPQEE